MVAVWAVAGVACACVCVMLLWCVVQTGGNPPHNCIHIHRGGICSGRRARRACAQARGVRVRDAPVVRRANRRQPSSQLYPHPQEWHMLGKAGAACVWGVRTSSRGLGRAGMGWDGMGWDGMGRDGMGREGTGWDVM